MRKGLIELTEKACEQVRQIMTRDILSEEGRIKGLRFRVLGKGCAGNEYEVEYVYEEDPNDEIVEQDGIKIYIDKKSIFYLLGSKIDYHQDRLESRFVFTNPNEKYRCGCGKSFSL